MVSCAAYKRLCSSWWMVNHQLKLGSRYKWNHCRALWPSFVLSSRSVGIFLPLALLPPPPRAAVFPVFKKSFIRSRSPRVDGDVVRSLQSKHGEKTSYDGGLPRSLRRCLSLEKMPMGGPADGRRAEKKKTITACARYGSKV